MAGKYYRSAPLALLVASVLVMLCVSSVVASRDVQGSILMRCLHNKRNIIDITHTLDETDPSDTQNGPHFQRVVTHSFPSENYRKETYTFPGGIGTTMDAVTHAFATGKTIDQYSPYDLISPVVVIDVQAKVASNPSYAVTKQDILDYEDVYDIIPNGSLVLAKTGWYQYYRNETAYRAPIPGSWQYDFPGFGDEAATFLRDERDIHALGDDSPSIDFGRTFTYGVHITNLGAGKYNLENLNLAGNIPPSGACAITLPMKIRGAPEAPIRALILY